MTDVSQIGDSDSEWEYEYDYSQTESHYAIIEFASDLARASGNTSKGKNGALSSSTRKTATAEVPEQQAPSETTTIPLSVPDEESGISELDSIQIIEPFSRNPIISRNNVVYSGSWGRTLGTDMVLAKPEALESTISPLLATEELAIVSTSRLKLIAKPVVLREKSPAEMHSPAPAAGNSDSSLKRKPSVTPLSTTGPEKDGDASTLADPARPNKSRQKQFLDRFNEIRKRRGQNGPILVRQGQSSYIYNGMPSTSSQNESTASPEGGDAGGPSRSGHANEDSVA